MATTSSSSSSDATAATDDRHLLDLDGGDQQTLCRQSIWRVQLVGSLSRKVTCEACRQEAARREAERPA